MKQNIVFLYLIVSLGILSFQVNAEIYKYQDKDGKWHFSDIKPAEPKTSSIEKITFRSTKSEIKKPFLERKINVNEFQYIVHNPLLLPIQIFLKHKGNNRELVRKVIQAGSFSLVYTEKDKHSKQEVVFRYVLGEPSAGLTLNPVLPPFKAYKPMKISQAFNGEFSHNRQPSKYAVDIGMTVGTKITAARAGTVIGLKDDYPIAGVSSPFFMDKANYVQVLHDDGSYAMYAHLLLGGVKVKLDQRVKAGELLALSGNTGYSTGPHLHFVIYHNNNGQMNSLPFEFIQPDKKHMKPKQGAWLLPMNPIQDPEN